ncbi:E3 ubiquitin/ISG15 ligase TRIM25 [Liparis tanakae]|uniref:E3 ubiquitin/ISG15 ligase TRIM25 n=1 Tax=Liparis tanakae TaxID=230148 RepID=A0A4Z2GKL6_9TELE|nr:E3 ubiquitin/ISG15 ligase TRIM25 [Liparis tanakae]
MDPAWSVAYLFRPLYPSVCHPGFPPVYQPKPLQPVYQPSSHHSGSPPAIPAAVAWSEKKDPLLQGMREALRALVATFPSREVPFSGVPSPVPVPEVPLPGVLLPVFRRRPLSRLGAARPRFSPSRLHPGRLYFPLFHLRPGRPQVPVPGRLPVQSRFPVTRPVQSRFPLSSPAPVTPPVPVPSANMALSVPVEEQFMCCICLDIFRDPTSTPCGHNFCLDCIEGYWDTKRECECPLCKETFSVRPKLSINYGFAEIIDFYISQTDDCKMLEIHTEADFQRLA